MGLVNNMENGWNDAMPDMLKDATLYGSKKSVFWVSNDEVYDILVTRRPPVDTIEE